MEPLEQLVSLPVDHVADRLKGADTRVGTAERGKQADGAGACFPPIIIV